MVGFYDILKQFSITFNNIHKLLSIMEKLIIKDTDKMTCDLMKDLRTAVVCRIERNICQMQKAGRNVSVCSVCEVQDFYDFIKQNGYTEERGLYDKLILEHNNLHPDNILSRWPRPDEDC